MPRAIRGTSPEGLTVDTSASRVASPHDLTNDEWFVRLPFKQHERRCSSVGQFPRWQPEQLTRSGTCHLDRLVESDSTGTNHDANARVREHTRTGQERRARYHDFAARQNFQLGSPFAIAPR